MNIRVDITPETKVGRLLDDYPELEETLIGMVPEFRKLKNPILRKTIARVTSLSQAARVGQISINDMIVQLREKAGLDKGSDYTGGQETDDALPGWIDGVKPDRVLDARPLLEEGKNPLEVVLSEIHSMKEGEVFELITSFSPAPLIDRLKGMGHGVYSAGKGDAFHSWFVIKK